MIDNSLIGKWTRRENGMNWVCFQLWKTITISSRRVGRLKRYGIGPYMSLRYRYRQLGIGYQPWFTLSWVINYLHAFKGVNSGEICFLSILWHIIWKTQNAKVFDRNVPIQPKINAIILIWLDVTNYIANDWQQTRKNLAHVDKVMTKRLCKRFNRKWGDHPLGPYI